MDIREFLAARLAMDEATARAATPGPWHEHRDPLGFCVEADGRGRVARFGDRRNHEDEPNATHIARWDPARVLAEVAAKRALIAALDGNVRYHDIDDRGVSAARDALELCLRHLAAPYADHPKFDPAWRLES